MLQLLEHLLRNLGYAKYLDFNPPHWMSWGPLTPALVNSLLVLAGLTLVILVYMRDGRRAGPRVALGILRSLLILYVIFLLNCPVLRFIKQVVEPSVVAVLIDDTASMSTRDVNPDGSPTTQPSVVNRPAGLDIAGAASGPATQPADPGSPTRLQAVISQLGEKDQELIRKLALVHTLRFYAFDRDARPLRGSAPAPPIPRAHPRRCWPPNANPAEQAAALKQVQLDPALLESISNLKPEGNSTQVVSSLLTVLGDLEGQHLAGIVVLSDSRETPNGASKEMLDRLRKYGVKVFAVPVGSEQAQPNVELVSLGVQDSVFMGDIVSAKVQVRGVGYKPGKSVRVQLRDKKHNIPLKNVDGSIAEKVVTLGDEHQIVDTEIDFKPDALGMLQVRAVAEPQPGESTYEDNSRDADVEVLDARINVLYVEGYPRWEYRYIKNEMIRDKTVNISCYLQSASPGFAQEGDLPDPANNFPGPISRLPATMEELMRYDVVLFGDVDPRLVTDQQFQMISNFVSKMGGGFGMVAGPKDSPLHYQNTALESVLPVLISNVMQEPPASEYKEPFRPVVTDEGRRGEAANMFRFIRDKSQNDKYLRDDIEPIYWYLHGVSVKPGVGLVYAEHPYESDPSTGRKAPLLVLGRFGAGRTHVQRNGRYLALAPLHRRKHLRYLLGAAASLPGAKQEARPAAVPIRQQPQCLRARQRDLAGAEGHRSQAPGVHAQGPRPHRRHSR